jgi:glycerol-3-phosphate acyltransferase PlsY
VDFAAYVVTALAAYLLGSIPTGFLVAKAKGVDIRQHGSGNIGATNVFRILGKPAGIFVLLADAAKGWLAVAILSQFVVEKLLPPDSLHGKHETAALLSGIFAILGHNYTCWLKFKGGKGVATTAGVLLAWTPVGFGIALAVWLVVFALSRFVSLASIVAAVSLPVATWLSGRSPTFIVVTAVLGALAIYKHKDNIKRLLNGTEHRVGQKKPEPEATKGTE